jgi:hypothetical protein
MLLLLFSFFPYITFHSFGSDIQPWAIVFIFTTSLLLFYKNFKLKVAFTYLLLPFIYAFLMLLISTDKITAIRSFVGYSTICLTPIVFYYLLKIRYKLIVRFLKFTTVLYFLVGLFQTLYDRNFMSFILNRISTTESRGVTSLTPEPTFYGIVCLFLILIFMSLKIENKKKFIYLLLFQIIFLSQSSMVILFLLIFYFYYFIFKLNVKTISIAFLVISICLSILYNLDYTSHNLRMFYLVNKFIEDPMNIFIIDSSVNDRVSAIYFSIKGFFDNYGIANGFGSYSNYIDQELPKQDTFWWVSTSDRIMSYYGGILFELGFVGSLIPITYSIIILKAYKYQINNRFTYVFFINTILMSAIPMSFPLVGMYLATLVYKANNENRT